MKASALKRAEAFSFAGIPACLWEILAFCPHLKKSHRNPSGFSASLKTGKFFPAFGNAVQNTGSPVDNAGRCTRACSTGKLAIAREKGQGRGRAFIFCCFLREKPFEGVASQFGNMIE